MGTLCPSDDARDPIDAGDAAVGEEGEEDEVDDDGDRDLGYRQVTLTIAVSHERKIA